MIIEFTKMHGLGNDFVVIDALTQQIDLTSKQIVAMADRHFGIGCDQLLLVENQRIRRLNFATAYLMPMAVKWSSVVMVRVVLHYLCVSRA